MELDGHGLVSDISNPAHRVGVSEWIAQNRGRLDVLVNNAGIYIRKSSIDYGEEERQKVFRLI